MIYLRCLLELMMVFPAAAAAILPVRQQNRCRKALIYGIALLSLTIFSLLGALLAARTELPVNLILFPFMVLFCFLYVSCYTPSFGKKLFCFCNASMLCAFGSVLAVIVTAPLEMEDETLFLLLPESGGICLGITVLILLLFYRVLTVKLPELFANLFLDKIWLPLASLPAFMTVLLVWATPVSPSNMMIGRARPIAIALFGVILIITLMMYHILWWIARHITRNAELEEMNKTFQMEQKRFEELRAYIAHTRTLRHDFRQHVILLRHYLDVGDLDALRQSLQEFDTVISGTRTAYCGNSMADAVAAHYVHVAEQQETDLSFSLYLPEVLPVSTSDLCVVLGNLLENALHAVRNLPPEERRIRVQAKLLTEEMIGITVSNPYTGEIRFDSRGIPRSERLHHGIGLRSVAGTVEQYQGTIGFQTENGQFQVSLTMFGNHEVISDCTK